MAVALKFQFFKYGLNSPADSNGREKMGKGGGRWEWVKWKYFETQIRVETYFIKLLFVNICFYHECIFHLPCCFRE